MVQEAQVMNVAVSVEDGRVVVWLAAAASLPGARHGLGSDDVRLNRVNGSIRVATERSALEPDAAHLHARTRDEARLEAASIGTPRGPRLLQRIAATIFSPWRGRGRLARDLGRVQGTIAAAAMAVPVVALDAVPVEPAAPALPVASVEIALEMDASTCRLPDGSIGRVAIRRRSDDDWAAICVQFPSEALPSAT